MKIASMEDLQKAIRETTVPLIKAEAGKLIADAVESAIDKHVKAQGQPSWAADILEKIAAAAPPPAVKTREREKGLAYARIVRAYAACKMDQVPYQEGVPRFLKHWGDEDLAKSVLEHREKAMSAGSPTGGGFLIPDQFSQDVIELLRPAAVIRKLGPIVLPMATGTIRIPKITAGATSYYQGENTNATKSELQTGMITLTFKKLITLVPMSNDLLRYSSPGADAIVRADIVRSMAQRENQGFLRDDGTAATPKGLRYWIPTTGSAAQGGTNLIAANPTVSFANTVTDLGKLIVALMNNNVPMSKPAWIFAPRIYNYLMTLTNTNGFFPFRDEMMRGLFWGYPYGITTQVPINLTDHGGTAESEVYLADMDDIVIGEALTMLVDTSQEAAYHDGTNVVAAFSQDQTVVRAIQEHDFAVRRAVSVAALNGVNWA